MSGPPPGCSDLRTPRIGPPALPAGVSVVGGPADARINLDDLDALATSLGALARRLESAMGMQSLSVWDLDALTERVGTAVAGVTGALCASPLSDEVRWTWGTASAQAADVRQDLVALGSALIAAAAEAERLADGLRAAREAYERAEMSVQTHVLEDAATRVTAWSLPLVLFRLARTGTSMAKEIEQRGPANVDYVGPALDVLTSARSALSMPFSPLVLARAAAGPHKPMTRAGTADWLTEVTDAGLVVPLTWLRTRTTRAQLPTPVMVAQPSDAAVRRAGTTAEALRTLETINRDAPDGAVGVQRTILPGGSSAWIVYVPGSEGSPDPRRKEFVDADHARSYANNTGLLLGARERSLRAVEAAMRAAGVRPGERVVFAGHSQGGIIATRLAAERGDGGVVTVGSPGGGIALPSSVEAVHFETKGDAVPELDGRPNPATPTRTTVVLRPEEALGTDHAAEDSRHAIGNGARVAEALEGSHVTDGLDRRLTEMVGDGHGPVRDLIPGPVTVYVPQPS